MGFQNEQDVLKMREALATRLAKFGLELHAEKTRVLEFGRFARQNCQRRWLEARDVRLLGIHPHCQ